MSLKARHLKICRGLFAVMLAKILRPPTGKSQFRDNRLPRPSANIMKQRTDQIERISFLWIMPNADSHHRESIGFPAEFSNISSDHPF